MGVDLIPVLRNWSVVTASTRVRPATGTAGFSGAKVWRVDVGDVAYALRCWQPRMRTDQVRVIHVVQFVLDAHGPPVVPRLEKSTNGQTIVQVDGRLWELATWRPGCADFETRPSPARLSAAMRVLAEIHRTLAERIATPWPIHLEAGLGRDVALAQRRRSKSAALRADRLSELVSPAYRAALQLAAAKAPTALQPMVREGIALVEKLAPVELDKARHWQQQDLPLQYRLGDVHHDHILFVDDEVTGVIDFGAVDFDAPVGDVARLLGSLVGDDSERWREGLAAYEAVQPLTRGEREAVEFFNSSGAVVAVANWVGWLWPTHPEHGPSIDNRDMAVARLSRLIDRLRRRT